MIEMLSSLLNYERNALIKNTSTTGADYCRLLALITMMAVKLQMFGGETGHVHEKVDHAGHGNNRQK